MSCSPLIAAIAALTALQPAHAQLVHLDFAEGALANKGSLGGEAEQHQPEEGDKSGKFDTRQESGSSNWHAVFAIALNGSQGPHLTVAGSKNALRLDKLEDELGIAFWINWQGPDAHPDSRQVIITTEIDPKHGWELGVLEDGKLVFSWVAADGTASQRSSMQGIKSGEWHHVAVTWKNSDREGLRFFLDGESVASSLLYTGGGPLAISESEIMIGCGQSYLPINGALADIRLYDRALETDEVSQLSQQGKP